MLMLALSLAPSCAEAQTKIYIDPGHGGADFGAVNATHGTREANRVLVTGLLALAPDGLLYIKVRDVP